MRLRFLFALSGASNVKAMVCLTVMVFDADGFILAVRVDDFDTRYGVAIPLTLAAQLQHSSCIQAMALCSAFRKVLRGQMIEGQKFQGLIVGERLSLNVASTPSRAMNGPERGWALPDVNAAARQCAGARNHSRFVAAPIQHGIIVAEPVPGEVPCVRDKWPRLPGGEADLAVWNENDSRLPRHRRRVHHATRIDIVPQDYSKGDGETQITNQLRRSKCG